ncbi:MAG: MbcA/ParS/Xre antitoxin family protein [Cyanobium sp.]
MPKLGPPSPDATVAPPQATGASSRATGAPLALPPAGGELISDGQLLLQAVLRAADQLDLSRSALARALGRDRSLFSRAKGIAPASKTGELALLLVRLYRSLAVLVGNDPAQMRHWFHTANHHTGGVPAEQVERTEALVEIVHYLDAMRAHI